MWALRCLLPFLKQNSHVRRAAFTKRVKLMQWPIQSPGGDQQYVYVPDPESFVYAQ